MVTFFIIYNLSMLVNALNSKIPNLPLPFFSTTAYMDLLAVCVIADILFFIYLRMKKR